METLKFGFAPPNASLLFVFVVFFVVSISCSDPVSGDGDGDTDGDSDSDVDNGGDGDADGDTDGDGDGDSDSDGDEDIPPVEVTCHEDLTATLCPEEGDCVTVGPCVLGCDEEAHACYIPSNVSADLLLREGEETGSLILDEVGPDVVINSSTGAIVGWVGDIRPGVEGFDETTGTMFSVIPQSDGPDLGVLILHDFTVPAEVTVHVMGDLPLVILATGTVILDGAIDAGSRGVLPGPGGYAGGEPGEPGKGPCAGSRGNLEEYCVPFCATGGGGAGHGGSGGPGGLISWVIGEENGTVVGGEGGARCGSVALIPLDGGSGGSGGTLSEEDRPEVPGPGGGGGGAVQITAVEEISIGSGGGITAPGSGGGTTYRGGGAGGGAGGSILLEAPRISIAALAYITANGGGGGGGDCT